MADALQQYNRIGEPLPELIRTGLDFDVAYNPRHDMARKLSVQDFDTTKALLLALVRKCTDNSQVQPQYHLTLAMSQDSQAGNFDLLTMCRAGIKVPMSMVDKCYSLFGLCPNYRRAIKKRKNMSAQSVSISYWLISYWSQEYVIG